MRGLFALLFLCDCFFPVRPFLLVLFCRPSVRTWSPFPPAFSWLSNPLGACYRSSKGRTIPSSLRPLQPTTTVACTATLWPEPRAEPRRDLPTDAPLRPHHLLHPQPPANSTASLLPTSNPTAPPPLSSRPLSPPSSPLLLRPSPTDGSPSTPAPLAHNGTPAASPPPPHLEGALRLAPTPSPRLPMPHQQLPARDIRHQSPAMDHFPEDEPRQQAGPQMLVQRLRQMGDHLGLRH